MKQQDNDVVIIGAARTAIGKFQGSLSNVPAPHLGGIAIQAAVERAQIDPNAICEVFMGNVVQAGEGQAPARQAALKAGLPPEVGATTINKVCGSGLQSVMLAAANIRAGVGDLYVAGGMENMNLAPYLLTRARTGYRLGNGELIDAVILDGLWDPYEQKHMGEFAEWTAETYGISRQDQDDFALTSHQRAIAAIDQGHFKDEIVPVPIPQRKGPPTPFDTDEGPRRDTAAHILAGLKPAFRPGGTVTAGNAPGITDGAAAVIVAQRSFAQSNGHKPIARVVGYAQGRAKPHEVFIAPVLAVRRLCESIGCKPADFDLIELNEAFAAQSLQNIRALELDMARVNVHGGAIALGHPIGASGARVLTTLLYAMRQRQAQFGLAALCLGGGEAVAMAVEME